MRTNLCKFRQVNTAFPNPFNLKSIDQEKAHDECHYFKSFQTSYESDGRPYKVLVEDYFSLGLGLTYSVHRNIDNFGRQWAVIGDSANSHFYIVRNMNQEDRGNIDCELDHAHNHRHVFPWQFIYNLEPQETDESHDSAGESSKKKKKSRNKKKKSTKPKKAFVYGVGAIWLNAITLNARSDQVGDNSSYPDLNSWSIKGRNKLRVELLFEKLSEEQNGLYKLDPIKYQEMLDQTRLNSIHVDRSGLVENPLAGSTTKGPENELELIVVKEYRQGSKMENKAKFDRILEQCRMSTKAHRLFPSLIRSLSTSPGQNYRMHYITERFPLYKIANGKPAEGEFDEKRHRYIYPMEFVTEVFSLSLEAQTKIYQPLPFEEAGPKGGRYDIFLDRFTERANNQRSSRHSTAHYHIVEFENDPESARSQCKVGEHEALPDEPLLVRPLTFKRETGDNSTAEYHGHLTGLGALLMNAADIHYKSFSLTGKTIRVAQDPHKLDESRGVEVDEWLVVDKKHGWLIKFFIEERDRETEKLTLDLTDRARGDLARLVQIEIRTTDQIDALDQTEVLGNDESNLLMRFTVVGFEFDADNQDIEFLTTPPEICADEADEAIDSDSDADSHYNDPDFFHNDRYFPDYSSDEDTNDDNDDDEPQNEDELDFEQQQGEEFELDPGMVHEDLEMPDFIEFLDGGHAYEILTKIVLEPETTDEDKDVDTGSKAQVEKYIWLQEVVNLKYEFTTLTIYNWHKALQKKQEIKSYYIFYEFELVFELVNSQCYLVDDVHENWLRLFTAQMKYYTVPNTGGQKQEVELVKSKALIESSKLSLYGVGALWRRASESEFTTFLGKKRQTLEIDGHEYRELVWNYEEHEMDIHFHFLEDLTLLEQDKKEDKRRPAHKYLKLHKIEFMNQFAGDEYQVSTFGKVRAEVEKQVIGKAGDDHFDPVQGVPKACRDQYWQAGIGRKQFIQETKPPSFADLAIGKASSYTMKYSIWNQASDAPFSINMKGSRAEVVESFDRQKNIAKIEVKTRKKSLTFFIDGNNKRIFAYIDSSQYGQKCTIVSSIAPIFSEAIHLNLAGNPEFDPNKLYGLANLINEFSKIDGKLLIEFVPRIHGGMQEMYEYKLHLEQSSPEKHEPQDISLKFYRERESVQVQDAPNKVIDGIRARSTRELELRSIEVAPSISHVESKAKNKFKMPFYKSLIDVHRSSLQPGAKLSWELPSACLTLASNVHVEPSNAGSTSAKPDNKPENSTTPPVGPRQFPDLKSLMERVNLFHMKSEVSIRGAVEKVYLLEEWSHNNHLRMRSHGLGKAAKKDFDFIMYEDSKEQFDLSRPFSCKRNNFPDTPLELNSDRVGLKWNLLQVWSDNVTLIDRLDNTYYSPLTLWRMAQKSTTKKQLLDDFQISLIPRLGEEPDKNLFRKFVERDLEKETWKVSSPDDDSGDWSYEMEFIRKTHVMPDGQLDTWHVLQSISIHDLEPITFGDQDIYNEHPRRRFNVFIDVADFSYKSQPGQILDTFRLPEGWGCKRAGQFVDQLEAYDELRLSEQDNWMLSYEASLELITDSEDDALSLDLYEDSLDREILPTASGVFLRSGLEFLAIQPEMDLSTHHSQIRFPDGQARARRVVVDHSKSVEYEIDKSNGFCTMALVREPGWQLEFPRSKTDSSKTQVVNLLSGPLKQSLFRELFLETLPQKNDSESDATRTPFLALNKFSVGDQTVHTSYEREVESLRLTDKLAGPARIVRKFSHQQFRFNSDRQLDGRPLRIKWHDDVTTRVLLFDPTKRELRAVFDVHLERRPDPSLSGMLAAVQVRQCFNDATPQWDQQVRTFTLEYSAESAIMRLMVNFNRQSVRDLFYDKLIKTAGLLPLQLDGGAQVGVAQHENLFRIHFDVMEAPTSHVYFKELAHCTMEAELEMKSETRLAATLLDCSAWCDQTNCAAMSYCFDHLCRVVTARAVFGKDVRSISSSNPLKQSLDAAQLHRLSSCRPDDSCTYYFQERRQPRPTLARLQQLMGRTVNQEREAKQLEMLSISLGFGTSKPVRFYEYGDQYRGRADDTDPEDLDMVIKQAEEAKTKNWTQHRSAFGVLERDKKLDYDWIHKTYLAEDKEGFSSIVVHVGSIADCFDACDAFRCVILSHCRQSGECLLATAKGSSAKKLFADIRPIQSKLIDGYGCSVYARDHLSKFHKYEATQPPKESNNRIDDASLLFCASMCQAAEDQCLSFDFCSYTDEKDQLRTRCMLQQSHVSLDSFDRSVLLPEWEEAQSNNTHDLAAGKRLDCDHYSKNLLADFRPLENRKFADREGGVVRGINEERCAATCLQDDKCRAFEFCRNDRRHPSQSCYLARQEALTDSLDEASEDPQEGSKQVSGKLTNSRTCSVYVLRRLSQADRLESTSVLTMQQFGSLGPSSAPTSSHFLSVVVWLIGAITLGAVVQFAHIKVTGRPLIFEQHVFL